MFETPWTYVQLEFAWPAELKWTAAGLVDLVDGRVILHDDEMSHSTEDVLLWISDGHIQFRFMELMDGLADFWCRDTLQTALGKLRGLGFVEHTGKRGHYRLTERGTAYLEQPAQLIEA